MLKKPGGALRAFIGAGFCAVILSLSACASKGAADIPIGGIINVGGGETPRPQPLPVVADTTILSDLGTASMMLDASAIRIGGDSTAFGLTERQYDFTDGSIIVQQLQFAHLGVWITDDDDIDNNEFLYASLNENPLTALPTPASSVDTATYDVEGDAVFRGLRFYPDGQFVADFNNGVVGGLLSARGNPANIDDDFGVGATLPNDNPVTAADFVVFTFLDLPISGGGFTGTTSDIFIDDFGGGGFFSTIRGGGFTGSGRFHDVDGYIGGDSATVAPAELSGVFERNGVFGGFLGEIQP